MEDIPSVSPTDLAERRRKLRRQRRWRLLQTSWQILVVSGMTAGLIWVVRLPDWMIHDSGQIVIEGNKTLSSDAVRSLLLIQYPQFLLALKPQDIAQQLKSQAPIADVTVTRRLFPPSLTVRIRERYPVAVVYSVPVNAALPKAQQTPIALLDETGTVISYENYVALNQSQQLPRLKVVGYQDQYRSQWAPLYQQVSRSPVKINEIDWRDPGNLILHTELGIVYFGSYSNQFSAQLRALDRMRQLPKDVDPDQISYIDLRNPDTPLIEMVDVAGGQAADGNASEEADAQPSDQPVQGDGQSGRSD